MKVTRALMLVGVIASMSGCAAGAKFENMVYAPEPRPSYPDRLKDAIEISGVTGGKATNPAWTSEISNEAFLAALRQSLRAHGLLAEKGPFALTVNLVGVEQPLMGINMTVTTTVNYVLTDTATAKPIWERNIQGRHTATMGDSLVGVRRLRLANEGSAKENIKKLMEELAATQLAPPGSQATAGTPAATIEVRVR